MFNSKIGVIILNLAIAVCSSVANAEGWIIHSEDHFPPYNYTDNGSRTGLDTEIVNAILKDVGVTPVHKTAPWKRVVASIDQDKTDLIFQLVPKPERFEKWVMVGPFRNSTTVFAVRSDSSVTSWNSLEDFKGLKLGVVKGYSYSKDFDKADFLTKVEDTNNNVLVKKLSNGRVDAIVVDLNSFNYWAKKEGVELKVRVLPKELTSLPRYVGFPKSRKDKADKFAASLKKLKDNGTIKKIIEKW